MTIARHYVMTSVDACEDDLKDALLNLAAGDITYVCKRKMEGKSNREIIRCLKRYIIREFLPTCVAQKHL